MLKQRAHRTVRSKSQSKQDAKRQRRKQNRDKQNSLPPQTLSGGAARNVCRNERAHDDNDQHGNAGEQKRDHSPASFRCKYHRAVASNPDSGVKGGSQPTVR